jgi:hypothetical protein
LISYFSAFDRQALAGGKMHCNITSFEGYFKKEVGWEEEWDADEH